MPFEESVDYPQWPLTSYRLHKMAQFPTHKCLSIPSKWPPWVKSYQQPNTIRTLRTPPILRAMERHTTSLKQHTLPRRSLWVFNASDWTLANITSSNIIFTHQSVPTEKIFWHISGSLMIYSCPRSSVKTCRRNRRQPCRWCQVRIILLCSDHC